MAHHPNNNRNTAMSDEFYRLSLLPPYVIADEKRSMEYDI